MKIPDNYCSREMFNSINISAANVQMCTDWIANVFSVCFYFLLSLSGLSYSVTYESAPTITLQTNELLWMVNNGRNVCLF